MSFFGPKGIPFNRACLAGREMAYIRQASLRLQLSADGLFSKNCQQWLEARLGVQRAILTHSGTDALEMAAILAGIGPGDEVIMPSYTFVTSANAFVLRGGVPVFVDIRSDTLNIDETLIERAVTKKTKAILAVHYGGIGCEMDQILRVARKHRLLVIEDAAQGILAAYKKKPLGSMGHLAALSFHETKNITCGEGGALLVNDKRFTDRADVVSQKGTNRKRFLKGQVDKYTWEDIGSSFLPSELTAAFLWAQMEKAQTLTDRRLAAWTCYDDFFKREGSGNYRRPFIPAHCRPNAHLYYLVMKNAGMRDDLIRYLTQKKIQAVFHYIPLHLSKAGRKFARTSGPLRVTEDLAARLVRLPLWNGITRRQTNYVCARVKDFFLHE